MNNPFSQTQPDHMVEAAAAILAEASLTPEQAKQNLRQRMQGLKDHVKKNQEKIKDPSLEASEKSRLRFQIDAMTKEIAWLGSKLNAPTP